MKCKKCRQDTGKRKNLCAKCYSKDYRKKNPDKIKAYRERTKKKRQEYSKIYREENKENIKETFRKYYQKNKERQLEYQNEYNNKNMKQIRENQNQYRKENLQRVKNIARKSHNNRNFNGLRDKILERDGHKCVKCGVTQGQHMAVHKCSLIVHHIDGEGRYSKNPNNSEDNLQTLCKRCHSRIHGKVKKRVGRI